MVTVAQLVESQIVILVVVGSSPIGHPIFWVFNHRLRVLWVPHEGFETVKSLGKIPNKSQVSP